MAGRGGGLSGKFGLDWPHTLKLAKEATFIFIVYSMYLCMVTHIARLWINRVRLPIPLVVS